MNSIWIWGFMYKFLLYDLIINSINRYKADDKMMYRCESDLIRRRLYFDQGCEAEKNHILIIFDI